MTSPFFSKKSRREAKGHAESAEAHRDSADVSSGSERKRHQQAGYNEDVSAARSMMGERSDHQHPVPTGHQLEEKKSKVTRRGESFTTVELPDRDARAKKAVSEAESETRKKHGRRR